MVRAACCAWNRVNLVIKRGSTAMTTTNDPLNCPELRYCRASKTFVSLYSSLRLNRHWHLGRLFIKFVMNREGGVSRSGSIRQIMRRYHRVTIGSHSKGGCFAPGAMASNTTIGRFVGVAQGVRTFTQNHPIDRLSTHSAFYNPKFGQVKENKLPPRQELLIESDVWIGQDVIITTGCRRVGIGAIIGAGAIVTKDVPDFAIVGGNPARVIRYRFDKDLCERVGQSRWWEKPLAELARNMDLMTQPLSDVAAQHPLLP